MEIKLVNGSILKTIETNDVIRSKGYSIRVYELKNGDIFGIFDENNKRHIFEYENMFCYEVKPIFETAILKEYKRTGRKTKPFAFIEDIEWDYE